MDYSKEAYSRRLVEFIQSNVNMTLVEEDTDLAVKRLIDGVIHLQVHDGALYAEVGVSLNELVIHDMPKYTGTSVNGLSRYRRFVDACDEALKELSLLQPPRVSEMGFTDRTVRVLEATGITNLSQLLERSAKDLSRGRGFGKKRLDDVFAVMTRYGSSLKST